MPLINCEILIWTKNCVISSEDGATRFEITDTKLHVVVVTLSTQNHIKESDF